eukprot:CAMPEP_0185829248 /NCGR_PEP_ID=MMETSP1353-20130828/133_1 /TAXON_ID=1077150 /ORGANISM="Erythrolobus australicus, Strain CCMP3124" /LENGTH=521 /DNA_ID=CAMNT_0028527013 /DNA_START=47 /DNA_END=1612 /DNA_ORIENTATION=+
MGNVVVAPPSHALIVTKGGRESRIQIGGRTFVPWLLARCDKLSLELRTIRVESRSSATAKGVMLDVVGVCQVKVSGYKEDDQRVLQQDDNAIRLAAQHFIGATGDYLESAVQATMEGHQRAILGTLTVEEVYRDRNAFADQVRRLAAGDMRSMGLEIVSYTLSSISDDEGYMDSLGVPQAEQVKRTAQEGRALHQAEAQIREKQESLKAALAVNDAKQKSAESSTQLALADAANQVKMNQAKARANNARELEEALLKQKVVVAEAEQLRLKAEAELRVEEQNSMLRKMKVEVEAEAAASADLIRERKEAQARRIEIEKEQAAVLVEQQKMEAERVRVSASAEMNCAAKLLEAENSAARAKLRAEATLAEKIKNAEGLTAYSEAEANAARAKGLAEVEVERAKMEVAMEALRETGKAYAGYQEAALRMEALKTMPLVAEQLAKPLQNTGKIVFMGGGGEGNYGHRSSAGAGGGPSAMLRDLVTSMHIVNESLESVEGTAASKLIDQVANHPYALQAVVRAEH